LHIIAPEGDKQHEQHDHDGSPDCVDEGCSSWPGEGEQRHPTAVLHHKSGQCHCKSDKRALDSLVCERANRRSTARSEQTNEQCCAERSANGCSLLG
jgi:hypothetical protein